MDACGSAHPALDEIVELDGAIQRLHPLLDHFREVSLPATQTLDEGLHAAALLRELLDRRGADELREVALRAEVLNFISRKGSNAHERHDVPSIIVTWGPGFPGCPPLGSRGADKNRSNSASKRGRPAG